MTGITLIAGFMIAVQFQTIKEPVVRDTRDNWELREDLIHEKKLELKLIDEIRSTNGKIEEYENETPRSKEAVLKETLAELKQEAGLTEVTGNGIVLKIESVSTEMLLGENPGVVTSELLQRLVNELNLYGAEEIAINDNRYVNTTVIREINKVLKMDGNPLNQLPIEIKVIAKDSNTVEKLFNYMKVSKSADEFFLSNLLLNVEMPKEPIKIPAYSNPINIHYMKPVSTSKGGDS
ncbi:DUF881 domain-containing protein [Niallia circulans]|uniref:NgoFVII family restriction endonuclease n=2 Tax=Niallia circulans TaxID=1397 RepID=A0AA91Z2F2_NIACI|nr:DUF881 domain-containing protein [Niallia circulans]PAD84399.1 NgoFVII family restriction endonuclease [Niallia circulans]UQZ73632.1 DUF881 domain-containing protein [Niallia circulans]